MSLASEKHLGRVSMCLLISILVLSGCSNSSHDAALKTELEQQKQELAVMKAEDAQLREQIEELRTRVIVLESAVKQIWPTHAQSKNSDSQQLTPNQQTDLQKVIVQCVQRVRALAQPGATPINDVHVSFDAYYNPATKRVENNNHYVNQSAVFAFNRCMTDFGWPLK